jgi:hypothetical protein
MHAEGVVVDHLDPEIVSASAAAYESYPRYDRSVDGVATFGNLGCRGPLDSPQDVGRRHLDALERRLVSEPLLESEAPREPVRRDLRQFGGEIRTEDGPTLLGRTSRGREQRSDEATAEEARSRRAGRARPSTTIVSTTAGEHLPQLLYGLPPRPGGDSPGLSGDTLTNSSSTERRRPGGDEQRRVITGWMLSGATSKWFGAWRTPSTHATTRSCPRSSLTGSMDTTREGTT